MNEPETNDALGQELPPQQSAEIPGKRKRGRPKGTTGIPWGKRLAPTRSSVKALAEAQESLKEALFQSTTALSQLNFGIDGFEFTAGIVDSHLPVDAALSGVDIV